MAKIMAGKVPAELSLELEEDDAETQPAAEDPVVNGAVPLVTAESPEMHCREWLNLFGVRGNKLMHVVDFWPGSGTAGLAACRHGHDYIGMACSDNHRLICRQQILLSIVLELILNKRDGFVSSRFLSKARSLGGEDPDPALGTPLEAATPASEQPEAHEETPSKVRKSEQTQQTPGSVRKSSSSSSDSSD